ncbi:alpha/beta hydrolase [Acuticoccus sp. M5D2P5]|uniref:alpha/beta fold hydrolase n=1 Tax=Acuticoccus kalidii TaxID=2910977 RepID=UPI001F264C2F|nr:alpha/beta hydrolase [Acuticoccus kalidii]
MGEPLVLVHGTPSSSLIWRNVLPRLTAAGYMVHVYDLLGYGLSERPWDPDTDTSISGQVRILEGMLAHWGLETTHLVAHDIGGAIAQRFGVFSPDRLRSLTLIDAVCFDSSPSPRTRAQMAAGLETLIKARDADHRAHFRDWLLSTFADPARASEDIIETYLEYIAGPVGQASFFQHQVRHYDPSHTMEIADRLPALGRLPVKIIWGAADAWLAAEWAERLHRAIPGSDLSIIDDCGHFAPEEQPDQVAEQIVTFLTTAGGRP